jgi:uncharacterized protein
VKAVAVALLALLAFPGCSVSADDPEGPFEPVHAIAGLPARPVGPVLDQADILSPEEEAKLDQRLRDLRGRTGDALVVVSVDSLGGETIESYAFNVFNAWGIGSAKSDRGLLLLVAPNERKVRIEVGCGLESTVSDVTAGRIIRERITPEYKTGDLAGGTLAGVDALVEQLAMPMPANDPGPHSAICRGQLKEAA